MSEALWSVPLPPEASEPVGVYVNSIPLAAGRDFTVEGRWIRIRRPIRPQPELGVWRRVMLGMGIGVYGDMKGDQVDVSYRLGDRTEFVSGVTVIPPPD